MNTFTISSLRSAGMKTLKKLTALLLVGAMTLSLAACGSSKKKVTSKEFKKIMKKADFTVTESSDDDADECFVATWEDEDGESFVYMTYYLFESKSDAKSCFNASYDELKEAKDDEEFEGDISKNSWKFTGEGEFTEGSEYEGTELYMVGILAEESMIIAMSTGDKAGKKALTNALSDLGYEI